MGKRTKTAKSRPDRIKWLLLAGFALALAMLVMVGWERYAHYRHGYGVTVDRSRFPIAGIDVSNHNGRIDFAEVRDNNYQFVIIKASEGVTHRDKAFARNYRDARKAGLVVGAYHYFNKERNGAEQAENLLSVVKNCQLDLPLAIDVENDDKDDNVSHKVVMQRLKDMVNHLEQRGHRVMIYTNGQGYRQFYQGHLEGCDLWLCSFKDPDRISIRRHCLQQFSHAGRVNGVDGDVDLNVFRGSKSDWTAFLAEVKQ